MKSSTAPSGGALPSSCCCSSSLGTAGRDDSTESSPRATLLDQRCKLLELRGPRDAEEVEEDRLGAGEDRARPLAQAQAGRAVRLGARDHRVLDEEDGEPAADQVADGLEDADVRLHPGDDHLRGPGAEDEARE